MVRVRCVPEHLASCERKLFGQLNARAAFQLEAIQRIRLGLGHADYPFERAEGAASFGEHVVPSLPPDDDPVAIHDAAASLLERYFTSYRRLLGRLAASAEHVEWAFGMRPLGASEDPR